MTKLSVNINKIATLRNARGHNVPNVIEAAINIQRFGAQGITVHPRPDERHITYADVIELKEIVNTEFNIEGNPTEKKFIDLVLQVKPTQVTLVPDSNSQLTSNHGWDTIKNKDFLIEVISEFKKHGIRTSIFVDPIEQFINGAQLTGTDRIELYTESYANTFLTNKEKAILNFVKASQLAQNLNLGVNAGHDLNLENLNYFKNNIPNLLEVSIGHALISDALYLGLENTVQMYLKQLL
ncbi:MAG: pyridoxine 5'-phosphate synthase [Bacteroidetes bacterium]|nr:pyridoxine 5'-phosphate synthase [Bacteroidota bacterium]